VVGNYKTCATCSVAKARQKNVNKDWKGGSVIAGERLYVDIISGEKAMEDRNYGL
jgi:hypothetical protein